MEREVRLALLAIVLFLALFLTAAGAIVRQGVRRGERQSGALGAWLLLAGFLVAAGVLVWYFGPVQFG